MIRSEIVNGLLELFDLPRYLEVGVQDGHTFFAARSNHKVAVDPSFRFDLDVAAKREPTSSFHQMTSDCYFGDVLRPGEQFDVIFLDGLHTFEQTLRDFCNAAKVVSPNGVIIVDDVLPDSYAASLPSVSLAYKLRMHLNPNDTDQSWMGDVYRLVFFIETFFQQFSYATVTEARGQLLAWPKTRRDADVTLRPVEAIAKMPFESVVTEEAHFRITPYNEAVQAIRAFVAERAAGGERQNS